MKLSELLKQDAEDAYRATEGLFKMVDDKTLGWKPATGENWMTVGQLLHHITSACGFCVRGFATGEWTTPEGADGGDMEASSAKMPAVKSVEQALKMLAADKAMCMKYIDEVGEDGLANKKIAAPWGGPARPLYQQFNHMIGHLIGHKGQLYYYLKLQGRPVHTGTLYGM
jgi:uncharacterized damage-inducible protein DinB